MDLKICDVADLLQVSEDTVIKWVSEGNIPFYRISENYYFSRAEIEDWMISSQRFKNDSKNVLPPMKTLDTKGKGGSKQFNLFRAVHKGDVFTNIDGATKEEVIRNTMLFVAKKLHIDADIMTELLLDREKMMPTSLNNGIGVPHTRDTLLEGNQDVVFVVFPKNPLEYGALDSLPVHTLFFLFACEDKKHLHLLAKIAHISSQQESLNFLQTKPSKNSLLSYLQNWESNLK